MKKLSFNLMIALMSALMMVSFSACDDDDDPEPRDDQEELTPVLGENFNFNVDGNDVVFTTTLSGNVWFHNVSSETDHNVADGEVTIKLPNAGTYAFTCNVLSDGVTYTSDEFDIVIEQDDLSFLNEGLWLHLSGGANETKTWRMDLNAEGEAVFFDGPLFYSGHDDDPYWSWNVLEEDLPVDVEGDQMESFFNWAPSYAGNEWLMPAQDYGTITFNATEGTVSTNRFGETCNSSFSFDPETMMLTINECIIPIDTARVDEGQFPDLSELRVYSLSDSAMQIGVKRVYEGFEDDGSQAESRWVHVYNFVVDDYEYEGLQLVYTPNILTNFEEHELIGTWKYNEVPFNWIKWTEAGVGSFANDWCTLVDVLEGDWQPFGDDTEAELQAVADQEFVFNSDGTCVLNGVENTWTLSEGVITLGTELDGTEFSVDWFGLSGSELEVVEPHEDCATGLWLAVSNAEPGKNESTVVNLEKVE